MRASAAHCISAQRFLGARGLAAGCPAVGRASLRSIRFSFQGQPLLTWAPLRAAQWTAPPRILAGRCFGARPARSARIPAVGPAGRRHWSALRCAHFGHITPPDPGEETAAPLARPSGPNPRSLFRSGLSGPEEEEEAGRPLSRPHGSAPLGLRPGCAGARQVNRSRLGTLSLSLSDAPRAEAATTIPAKPAATPPRRTETARQQRGRVSEVP